MSKISDLVTNAKGILRQFGNLADEKITALSKIELPELMDSALDILGKLPISPKIKAGLRSAKELLENDQVSADILGDIGNFAAAAALKSKSPQLAVMLGVVSFICHVAERKMGDTPIFARNNISNKKLDSLIDTHRVDDGYTIPVVMEQLDRKAVPVFIAPVPNQLNKYLGIYYFLENDLFFLCKGTIDKKGPIPSYEVDSRESLYLNQHWQEFFPGYKWKDVINFVENNLSPNLAKKLDKP